MMLNFKHTGSQATARTYTRLGHCLRFYFNFFYSSHFARNTSHKSCIDEDDDVWRRNVHFSFNIPIDVYL